MKYWIGYITYGVERYEHNIEFVGVAVSSDIICRKIRDVIISEQLVYCDHECEENYVSIKEFNNFFINKIWNPPDNLSAIDYLRYMVERYNDSYYQDGWDYTIQEVELLDNPLED